MACDGSAMYLGTINRPGRLRQAYASCSGSAFRLEILRRLEKIEADVKAAKVIIELSSHYVLAENMQTSERHSNYFPESGRNEARIRRH